MLATTPTFEIDAAKIKQLASSTVQESFAEYTASAAETPFNLPLRFDSASTEIDVLALTCALNFGSSFKTLLNQHLDRGDFDCVRFGVMAMYITEGGSGRYLTAAGMKDLSLSEVSSLFDVPISREVKHATLEFVTVSEHHPLRPFASKIQSVINEIGAVLQRNGYSSLGAFILAVCKPAPISAATLISALSKAFPCFNDAPSAQGKDFEFHLKAQRLAFYMHQKFPTLVSISESETPLNTGSDPAVTAALTSQGILIPTETASEKLKSGFDFGKGSDVDKEVLVLLRAASVSAIEALVAEVNSIAPEKKVSAMGMSLYLRSLAKSEPRLIDLETVYF
ncbi:hypothetical protein HDU78_000896 [Chytriomyces hyalinus]|nr:hypothetical protein HDU78_000896 [Chytriomyces hyalinus]